MKLLLNILTLSANLPLEDSDISFILSTQNTPNSLSDDLNCTLDLQHVLMSDITEMTFPDARFIIEVENPQEPKNLNLFVLATSISTSKAAHLGLVRIDIRKLLLHQIQNGTRKTIKEPLLDVNNQKGNLTFEIQTIQTQIYSSHRNLKSSESLDREQTCSSDSYEANLKDLNKTSSSDETEDFSPKVKLSPENHYRNVDYTNKIILEEIDLEDEDDEIEEIITSKLPKGQTEMKNINKKPVDVLRNRLLEQRLKIQMQLHNLQESDFFLMRIEQKLRDFAQ